ncbi:MAG TPA: DUF2281 domain-containing protein [Aggregatilineales bacterium]|nr:DUF2281 domain-containing protein [Aggregatilineales bacterium]
MSEPIPSIEELVKQLPPDLQNQVRDYAQYLLDTKVRRKGRRLRLDWAGGLAEYRDRFTSLDLQKKALEWWEE